MTYGFAAGVVGRVGAVCAKRQQDSNGSQKTTASFSMLKVYVSRNFLT